MGSSATSRRKYRFGLFELDPASGELRRQGVRVRMQDQPLRLLTILLENAGQVVSQEDLRHQLWPADTYVEFDGSMKAALKRLRGALGDSADNPIFIETIPKRGYRFIAPVTTEGSVESPAVLPAPSSAASAREPSSSAPPTAPPTARRGFLAYALTAFLALVVALIWLDLRHPSSAPSPSSNVVQASIPVRKSVAVLGFHNASARSEDDWLATAFSEMLSTELASGAKLRLVPGEEVVSLRVMSPWPQVGTLGQQTALRLGGALNSDVLVLGSYAVVGSSDRGQVRFDVSLQDGRTGAVIAQVAQTSNREDVLRAASVIGAKLREQLGVPAITDADEPALLASMPVSREGARFYALGIAKLREFDALAAKDLLLQAVAADPKFPLAHAALATAWSELGYEQKHKEEAKKAFDLSGDLPRAERLQVEGDYYESLPDHEKAASAYRAMFELFPDSVDCGLELAYAENAAGHASEALETIARLRRLPAPALDDPLIDLAEARMLPADKEQEALALRRRAEAKAESQGKKLIYARARLAECMGLVYGEHPEQADAPCQDAYNIYRAAGNNLETADALRLMGDQQGGEGHIEAARAIYERALKILAGQDENLKTAVIFNNMAIGYTNQGHLEKDQELYRKSEQYFERGGDLRNAEAPIANQADILYLRGNLSAAAKAYQRSIDIGSSIEGGSPDYALQRLADLELTRGDVHEAYRLATQAVDSLRGRKGHEVADAALELGDVLRSEGDLQGARRQYQTASEVKQSLGRTTEVQECQGSIAQLDVDEGRPDDAETLLRPAIAQFEKENADPDSISAYTLLSRALLREGKIDDARKAIQHAVGLGRTSVDPNLNLSVEIETARVDIAAAGPKPAAAALARLRAVIATAQKLGYYQLECEARLELAAAELKIDPPRGRSQLTSLEQETHDRGLALLSSQAHHLLTANSPSANSALPR